MFESRPSSLPKADFMEDLKNFRLVCKCWHDESRKLWSQTRSVTLKEGLTESDQAQAGSSHSAGKSLLTIKAFMEYYKEDKFQLKSNPYSSFELKECVLNGDCEYEKSFWKEIGPLMKVLTLEKCTFTPTGDDEVLRTHFRSIVYENTPNLHTFTWDNTVCEVKLNPNDDYFSRVRTPPPKKNEFRRSENLKNIVVGGYLPILWREMLYRCPNLESVTILNEVDKFNPFRSDIVEELEPGATSRWIGTESDDALGLCRYPMRIKHFDLGSCFYFHSETLRGLDEINFPIESLTISLDKDEMTNLNLVTLLTKNKETFQELRIDCIDGWKDFSATRVDRRLRHPFVARLNSLVDLTLTGPTFEDFQFLCFMPNLERLYIDLAGFENGTYTRRRSRPVDMVTRTQALLADGDMVWPKLTEFRADYPFSKTELKTLSEWMPNISNLGIVFNNETIRDLHELWPKLSELSVLYGSHVRNDGAIAGVARLEYLRSFQLEAYCNRGRLADASGYFVFLKLPNLEFLKICVSPDVSICCVFIRISAKIKISIII